MEMRIWRLICALVLTASLVVLPVAAAMAVPHSSQTESTVSATPDDCSCCQPADTDSCLLTCWHAPAMAVEGWLPAKRSADGFAGRIANQRAAATPRPDPPPPRL